MDKICKECGVEFVADYEWKTFCKKCYARISANKKEEKSSVQIIHAVRPDEDTIWFRENFKAILSMCSRKKNPPLYDALLARFENRPPWEE